MPDATSEDIARRYRHVHASADVSSTMHAIRCMASCGKVSKADCRPAYYSACEQRLGA